MSFYKKTSAYRWLLMILSGGCGLQLGAFGVSLSSKPALLQIEVESTQSFAPFLGYNMQLVNDVYDYATPALLDAVQPLHPAYLRFPGGTAGNFYHWEIDGFNTNDFIEPKHPQFLKRTEKLGVTNYLNFCKEVAAEPIIVFNIYTEDTTSPARFLAYLNNLRIVPIKYGMIGCENYASNQNVVNFLSGPEEFFCVAQDAYNRLKAVDPLITLAVNMPAVEAKLIRARTLPWMAVYIEKYLRPWDKINVPLWEASFDAFESHTYIPTPAVSQAQQGLDVTLSADGKIPLPQQWLYLLFAQHETISNETGELQRFYPKPVWQDEGGIELVQTDNQTRGGMAGLLDAEYLFLTSDRYPWYQRVCRHVISSSTSWGILGSYNPSTRSFGPHPPRYQFCKLLGNINTCSERVRSEISDASLIAGEGFYSGQNLPGIASRVFKKGNTLLVYFINRKSIPERVKIVSTQNLVFPAKLEYVGGFLGNDGESIGAAHDSEVATEVCEKIITDAEVILTPYSLSLLTLQVAGATQLQ